MSDPVEIKLISTHFVGISRNAGDTFHSEVKPFFQRETCLLHKDNEKPSQAGIHMEGNLVFHCKLYENSKAKTDF